MHQELALLKQLAHMELVLEKIHRLDIWKSKLQVSSKTLRVMEASIPYNYNHINYIDY